MLSYGRFLFRQISLTFILLKSSFFDLVEPPFYGFQVANSDIAVRQLICFESGFCCVLKTVVGASMKNF